jgi:hypothetical protein
MSSSSVLTQNFTHRESRCRGKVVVLVVPAERKDFVTMSRDPDFENPRTDVGRIEDYAPEMQQMWLISCVNPQIS